ncbi:TPA: lytic transglycosylase domain-containing protein [Citrobacter freundii]|jgi:type IV secretion system protein VirB1|uniref:Lytic Transglycosylase (LT) and Goose Egg White Lysozyme (GEWL) domain protein n=1 Tax=Klebsiella pneumoniae TaxID=573 RepID=A0A223DQA7_KLEPN|nr:MULTISPECIES: lytic transglycosylase domain-containing protein [Enterobacteriaceae]ASS84897.1 Lytic Transglycosylase (LT) and Goose Egg White Lysozyme (GEWL) domain protein [Klebsiella pneumoniae]EKT8689397.1 lytic transglycosylase domain-containing protein [Citrobacter freundii]MBA7999393.1 lytic transglycosylase domain-containing protein [Citrobacter freundii]MBJ9067998.1 lytic transglycosylase domain-containing protein [Citrobacter freundii]MCR3682721.1 lytic transglycosylase domain-cont
MKKIITAMISCLFIGNSAFASMSDPNEIHKLVKQCAPGINADSKIVVGIVRTESAGNPYSIGINTKGVKLKRQPKNIIEAIEIATWLAKNRINFDAGIAQINSVNINKLLIGDLDFRMRKVFDPCENLGLAETIFNSCYDMTGSTVGALSCYNTGNAKRGIKNGYVAKVLANIPELVDVSGDADRPKVRKRIQSDETSQDESLKISNSDAENKKADEENKSDSKGDAFATNGVDDVFGK